MSADEAADERPVPGDVAIRFLNGWDGVTPLSQALRREHVAVGPPGGRTPAILPGASVSRPHMGRCPPMAGQPLAARRTLRHASLAGVVWLTLAGPVAAHGE